MSGARQFGPNEEEYDGAAHGYHRIVCKEAPYGDDNADLRRRQIANQSPGETKFQAACTPGRG